jgi:hypothetical protein
MGIDNVPLNVLFRDYSRVIATLANSALTHHVSLELEQLRAELGGQTQTFGSWLAANGSATLPTSDSLPTIKTRYANFADAVHAGYKVTPTHPTISPSSPLPVGDKTDLVLTRAETDYEMVYRHALVNVNGFYHQTDHSPDGLFVTDGMTSCLNSNRNEIGLLSFINLGSLSFIPIKDEMIYTQRPEQKLRYNCYIDTGVDLTNKTVMLVLGGYLHVLDRRAFFRIGSAAFGIDFGKIPLVDRYYESCNVLDLSSLSLASTDANPAQISVNNLYSDDVLRRYLQLSQTFLVVLDNTEIFTDALQVRPSRMIGVYTSTVAPIYPLSVGRGRHETYWYRKEDNLYSINASGTWRGERNYNTTKTTDLMSVSDANVISMGFRNSQAMFQLIGSDFYIP